VWEASRQRLWGFRCWGGVADAPLNGCLGTIKGCDESDRSLAIGRTGVVQRKLDTMAVYGRARVNLVIACRELANLTRRIMMLPRIELDHDVSILITAGR
jgi:hypothetical protein